MIIFNSFVAGMCFAGAVYEAIHYKRGKGKWIIFDIALCLFNFWCAWAEYTA